MNILILSWRGPGHPNAGGAEQVAHEHAKAWIKAGHNITLFTSYYFGAKENEVLDGVEIIRKGGQIFSVHLSAFIWYLLGKHKKFDIVIDHFHGIPFFTPLYVRTGTLAVIHEVAKEVWKLNPWKKPFNIIPSFLGTTFEPAVFKLLYKNIPFLTVSESTRDDLVAWGIPKKNITVIHNGVNIIYPNKIVPKDFQKIATYLGAISEDKGIFDAIKTFAEINRKDEDWTYWIIGKGTPEYLGKTKELITNLGIESKVKYWGFVSDRKKFELLSKSFLLVNPSVREGWCLVNIESSAVGTPVIGYDVAGMKDSVKNNQTGILVTKGDYKALADTSLKLMMQKTKYSELSKKAVKYANKFNWEKAGKESVDLIESL